jgi:hypothetical protein
VESSGAAERSVGPDGAVVPIDDLLDDRKAKS